MQTNNDHHGSRQQALILHQQALKQCQRCPQMNGPVITGQPTLAKIVLVGQAPGIHEAEVLKPFGWTAGKTLFRWFNGIGVDEATFRAQVYIASVCRCFPGKQVNKQGKTGGDRVPSQVEIANCTQWMQHEFELLKPEIIIAVGKLAINQFIAVNKLAEIIGSTHRIKPFGQPCTLIPLPHPSGASTWHRMEPGKSLLQQALQQLAQQTAWQEISAISKAQATTNTTER